MSNKITSIPIDPSTERSIFDDLYSTSIKYNNTNASTKSIDVNLSKDKFNYDSIINILSNTKVKEKD